MSRPSRPLSLDLGFRRSCLPASPCMALNELSSSAIVCTSPTCVSRCRAAYAVFCQSLCATALLRENVPRCPAASVAVKSEDTTSPAATVTQNVITHIATAPRGSRATAANCLAVFVLGSYGSFMSSSSISASKRQVTDPACTVWEATAQCDYAHLCV